LVAATIIWGYNLPWNHCYKKDARLQFHDIIKLFRQTGLDKTYFIIKKMLGNA
jgi:hypothetical protein